MKIGIVCPIGKLKKFGYHHISDIVLQSFCSFADKVVLISSTREPDVMIEDPKIQLVSSPQTWFDLDEKGNEHYSVFKVAANVNIGLDILAEEGFDIALNLSINNYIPETKFKDIQHYLLSFLQQDEPVTWLYKMYQCGSQLFDADMRLGGVFNLHHRNRYTVKVDLTLCFQKRLFWRSTKKFHFMPGSFKDFNRVSVVDVIGEFTEKECEALWTFVGDRGGYKPARRGGIVEFVKVKMTKPKKPFHIDGIYAHEEWLSYWVHKLQRKHPSSEQLDTFGAAICERSRPDFVCHELLRRLRL